MNAVCPCGCGERLKQGKWFCPTSWERVPLMFRQQFARLPRGRCKQPIIERILPWIIPGLRRRNQEVQEANAQKNAEKRECRVRVLENNLNTVLVETEWMPSGAKELFMDNLPAFKKFTLTK